MGHFLNYLDRQQLQLWSLIHERHELDTIARTEIPSSLDAVPYIDELLYKYENALWQILPIQIELRAKLVEVQSYQEQAEEMDTMMVDSEQMLVIESTDDEEDRAYQPDAAMPVQSIDTNARGPPIDIATHELQFECEVCKKSFRRQTFLDHHMRSHEKEARYACAECGEIFSFWAQWRAHIVKKHGRRNTKKFGMCHLCRKVMQLSVLKSHIEKNECQLAPPKRKKKKKKKLETPTTPANAEQPTITTIIELSDDDDDGGGDTYDENNGEYEIPNDGSNGSAAPEFLQIEIENLTANPDEDDSVLID